MRANRGKRKNNRNKNNLIRLLILFVSTGLIVLAWVLLLGGLFRIVENKALKQQGEKKEAFLTQEEQEEDEQAESIGKIQDGQPDIEEDASRTSEEAAEESREAKLEDKIQSLTLEEKICQLFFITPECLTGYQQVTKAGDVTHEAINQYPVGGIMLSTQNLESVEQVREMNRLIQQYAAERVGIPVLISVDEEGGDVARCAQKLGTASFSPMFEYRNQGKEVSFENARVLGETLFDLGYNLDFAPVADVWSNPQNTVIGRRAYSDDFAQAAELVASAVKGFHEGGVACTLKHFPGHGNTAEDSHSSFAYSSKSMDELQGEELLPFQRGIEEGADVVMTGHIIMSAIEERPASLSSYWIQQVLRKEMRFDGVVITDSLGMAGVRNLYEPGELCVQALLAGNDMLLMTSGFKEGFAAIQSAVAQGRLAEGEIDRHLRRILRLKSRMNP